MFLISDKGKTCVLQDLSHVLWLNVNEQAMFAKKPILYLLPRLLDKQHLAVFVTLENVEYIFLPSDKQNIVYLKTLLKNPS